MPKVTVKEVSYKNFGKCAEISNGTTVLSVTLEVGPRIIRYAYVGGENIFFEDAKRAFSIHTPESFDSPWYIYGGHRLWTSPESPARTYYPDNAPVSYTLTPNGAEFTQPIPSHGMFQCRLSVTLSPDTSDVTVLHTLINLGSRPLTLAIWGVTSLSPGGLEIVPLPVGKDACVPNRILALWPHTSMTDPRVKWANTYFTLFQDRNIDTSFKCGVRNIENCAMYFNHGDVFTKRFDYAKENVYPDGGMSFETFTNDRFLEMESLGAYAPIPVGGQACHREYWALQKCTLPEKINEKTVADLMKTLGSTAR